MVKAYRNYRKLHNQQLAMYLGEGEFDIPSVSAYHGEIPDKWIGFNGKRVKRKVVNGEHIFDGYER